MADEDFLRRWSRRKSEARRVHDEPAPQPPAPAAAGIAPQAEAIPPPRPPVLPDPATLEPGADISAFMAQGVEESVRRRALKSLFSDPRFNVMDGLDVYIDDYSIPDPLPPDWLDKLEQVSHLGDRGARDREAEAQAARAGEAGAGEGAAARDPEGAAPSPRGGVTQADAGQSPAGQAEGDTDAAADSCDQALRAAHEGAPGPLAAS